MPPSLPRLIRADGVGDPPTPFLDTKVLCEVALLAAPTRVLTHYRGRTFGCAGSPETCRHCRDNLSREWSAYSPVYGYQPGNSGSQFYILPIPTASLRRFADPALVGQVLKVKKSSHRVLRIESADKPKKLLPPAFDLERALLYYLFPTEWQAYVAGVTTSAAVPPKEPAEPTIIPLPPRQLKGGAG